MRETFKKGDRVKLIRMTDSWTKLEPGTLGTVVGVDTTGTVHVSWDSGSRLGLIPGADIWVKA